MVQVGVLAGQTSLLVPQGGAKSIDLRRDWFPTMVPCMLGEGNGFYPTQDPLGVAISFHTFPEKGFTGMPQTQKDQAPLGLSSKAPRPPNWEPWELPSARWEGSLTVKYNGFATCSRKMGSRT